MSNQLTRSGRRRSARAGRPANPWVNTSGWMTAVSGAASSSEAGVLITIPISHFCEKARWALDHAGLSYREHGYPPAVHRLAVRRQGSGTATALAGGGVGLSTSASANGEQVTKVGCTLELFALGAPNPSGIHVGFVTCPRPFGKGLHSNAYTVTPTGTGQGTVAGSFKNYYRHGTTSGTVALTFSATSPMNISYAGTVTYTGGTGTFRHVRGRGTIQCVTSDGGAHKSCTVNSTLTGV